MANITINNTPTRAQYEATGGQTVFTYSFPIKAQTDLIVYKRGANDPPDDSADVLTLTTDYTVTGANTENGGTVTLVVAATAGDIITIVGDKPIDRTAIYNTSSTLKKEDLNNDFNDNVMYDKQIETIANELTPKYARSELIGPGVREDNTILPILNDGYIWRGRGNRGDSPDDVEAVLLSTLIPTGTGTTGLQVTQNGHGFVVGDWVRLNGANYVTAQANSAVSCESWWVVTEVPNVNTFVIFEAGHVDLTGAVWGPFTAGDVYFISATNAGRASTTKPTNDGEVSKPCFIATSNTTGWIIPCRGQIQEAAAGGGGAGGAPVDATYITQTPNGTLTAEQALSLLGTGIMYNTTGTGVISIATNGTNYYGPGTPVAVPIAEGGTGATAFTQYEVVVGGAAALASLGSVGTAGYILTSNGAGANPSWQVNAAIGAGGTVVATGNPTGVASIDFDGAFAAGYEYYEIRIACLTTDTDDDDILFRVGTGAGPVTYQATNYDYVTNWRRVGAATNTAQTYTAATSVVVDGWVTGPGNGLGNAAGESLSAVIKVYCPASANYALGAIDCDWNNTGVTHQPSHSQQTFQWRSTTAVTSFQLISSTGLITGEVSVIGYTVGP